MPRKYIDVQRLAERLKALEKGNAKDEKKEKSKSIADNQNQPILNRLNSDNERRNSQNEN